MNKLMIFRRSSNTNSFGLREYFCYNPETREVFSFATAIDWPIGTELSFTQLVPVELWRLEHTIAAERRSEFETKFIDPLRLEPVNFV